MITGSFQPIDEQQAVIEACTSGADLVIEAGAGTGKTATLQMAAAAMGSTTGLYLAYNRATASSARTTFPQNVRCATAHSLAYAATGSQYAHRLSDRATRVPAWAAARTRPGSSWARSSGSATAPIPTSPPAAAPVPLIPVRPSCSRRG